MIGGMESWGSSPADGEREMTDTTTTTIGITTPTYRPITTWYEQMQADWAAESAAYDWDAIEYPVSLDEQVAEAMLMMTIDLERGTQDYLGQVNELNRADLGAGQAWPWPRQHRVLADVRGVPGILGAGRNSPHPGGVGR